MISVLSGQALTYAFPMHTRGLLADYLRDRGEERNNWLVILRRNSVKMSAHLVEERADW